MSGGFAPEYVEEKSWLVDQAAVHGFRITSDDVVRWHRAGLLPPPKQLTTHGRSGSKTLYPVGTLTPLLRLCEVRRVHKRFERNGWDMWWRGFPVHKKYWMPILEKTAKHWDKIVVRISEPGEDGARDLKEMVADISVKAAKLPASGAIAGDAKRRLGPAKFATLLNVMLDGALGNFESWENRDPGADHLLAEMQHLFAILFRGLENDKAPNSAVPQMSPSEYAEFFAQLAPALRGNSLAQTLAKTEIAELLEARNEFAIALMHFAGHAAETQKATGWANDTMRWIIALAEGPTIRGRAGLFILWLVVRKLPAIGAPAAILLQQYRAAFPPIDKAPNYAPQLA